MKIIYIFIISSPMKRVILLNPYAIQSSATACFAEAIPGYFAWCLGKTRQAQAVASANEGCINLWYHLLKKQRIKKFLLALTGPFLLRMACFCFGMPVFASHGLFSIQQAACFCLGRMPVLPQSASRGRGTHQQGSGTSPNLDAILYWLLKLIHR